MTSLRKTFGVGQLPDKFRKRVVDELDKELEPLATDSGIDFQNHAANVEALLRMSRALAKPQDATRYQVTTLRAVFAAHGICPDCGGHVHVDDTAQVVVQNGDERELTRRDAPVAFCSVCEFCLEISE